LYIILNEFLYDINNSYGYFQQCYGSISTLPKFCFIRILFCRRFCYPASVFLASGLLVYHEFSYGAFRSSVFLCLAFGYRAYVIHPKQLGYKFENDV